jgi:hypothetical protein
MLRHIVFIASFAAIAYAQERPEFATVKIISPDSGLMVHPGQTVDIEVAVTGQYSLVAISESLGVIIGSERSLGAAPYLFRVQIPARLNPRPYAITATLYAPGRINPAVATDSITLDVEPLAPPRKLSIDPDRPLILPVGGASQLYVNGTFDGQNELNLNWSTLTTYQTDPPGIVSVDLGGISALAPGTAKVTVRHQGLQSSVTVTVRGDELRITTAPTEGTIVHPGQELSVGVSASGGPFKKVFVLLGQDFDAGAERAVEPYWFSFTVPASAKIGPTRIIAMGFIDNTQVFSPPVTIDVERTNAPQTLFTDVDRYGTSTWVGGYGSIYVFGEYSDNPYVDLSASTLTSYEASSQGIVSIEKNGEFKGLAAGSTTIVIRHRDLSITVKVVVRE